MQGDVSTVRLYVLRASYAVLVVGLGAEIWPLLLRSAAVPPEHMQGVVRALLGALSLLAVLGLRYPLRMLPLLFFELTWKAIWLLAIGLPLWRAGRLDAGTAGTLQVCLMAVLIVPLLIPWGYVLQHYLREPGDRWRGRALADDAPLEAARSVAWTEGPSRTS